MRLPKANQQAREADKKLRKVRKRRAVQKHGAIITAHGIWTDGHWQDQISKWIQRANFEDARVNYGNVLLGTIVPGHLDRAMQRLQGVYEELLPDYEEQISIIAHSYGSLALATLLREQPATRFDKVILYGSIIDRRYPWRTIFDNSQVREVLHEAGGKDAWAKIAPFAYFGHTHIGSSGARGFYDDGIDCFHQYLYPEGKHSTLQNDAQFKNVWIPFIDEGCGSLEIAKAYEYNPTDPARKTLG